MRRQNSSSISSSGRARPVLVAAGAAALLGGCESYLDRRDTVSRVAGNAVVYNRMTQTIDRWPETSRADHWRSDGERGRINVDRYRKREIGENKKSEEPSAVSNQGGATTK